MMPFNLRTRGERNLLIFLIITLMTLTACTSDIYIINENQNSSNTSSSEAVWGNITGTLSDQTDLQNALDNKVSVTGDVMTGELDMQNTNIRAGSTGNTFQQGFIMYRNNLAVGRIDNNANNFRIRAETSSNEVQIQSHQARGITIQTDGTTFLSHGLDVNDENIINVANPTLDHHASNKEYVDSMAVSHLSTSVSRFPNNWAGGAIYSQTDTLPMAASTGWVFPEDVEARMCVRLRVNQLSGFFMSSNFLAFMVQNGGLISSSTVNVAVVGLGNYQGCNSVWSDVDALQRLAISYMHVPSPFGEWMQGDVLVTIEVRQKL